MQSYLKHYIDGAWVDSDGGKRHEVIDPSTEQAATEITLGSEADVNKAVAAAKKAFKTWSQSSVDDRIALLERIIALYKKRIPDLAAATSREMGAPISFANMAQAPAGLGHFMGTLAALKEFSFSENAGKGARVVHEPIGVVAMITPWNWPLNQICAKVAPALAAGNTMVLKPSPFTPFSALLFGEIAEEIGLPKGVLNIVTGGPEVGTTLTCDPRVDLVTFTGSEGVGAAIMAQAAPTLKRVHLELGGKSALIVRQDADVARAAGMAVAVLSVNAGQGCALLTRLVVHNSIRKAFVETACAIASQFKIGDPADHTVAMGPLIRESQREKVERLIAIGRDEGARIVHGGGRPVGLDKGFFTDITIFDDVDNKMTIAQEEVFGPVGCVIGFDTDEEAIRIANDSRYGLNGGIETADAAKGYEMAMKIRAGSVMLNGGTGRMTYAPIGGYKRSGVGREYGPDWLHEYQNQKSVFYPIGG